MVLFNIFGKQDGSENNSGEPCASEIAELRARLARAEQERDALAREKNSLTQRVKSLAQENQSLTRDKEVLAQDKETLAQDKETLARDKEALARDKETLARDKETLARDKEVLAQQVETLKKEYEPLKKSVDFIQNTVRDWPGTIASILNTAKKEGFNDDPLAHNDVAAIINDINGHLVTWLSGYAEHIRRYSDSSQSKGPGNGSEKIDEAALGKALEKLHESLTAETDAAASENPAPATEASQQPDTSELQAREQTQMAEEKSGKPAPASQKPQTKTGGQAPKKKLTKNTLYAAIEEILKLCENGVEGIETVNKFWFDSTKDPNTRRMLAVSSLFNPENIAVFEKLAEREDLDDNTKSFIIAMCQCCGNFSRRFFKLVKRYIKEKSSANPHPNGTKDRKYARKAERAPSPKDCKENLPSVCPECKTPLKILNPAGEMLQVLGLLSMIINSEEFVHLVSAYPEMLYCPDCHKIFTPRIIDAAITAAAPGYNINLLTLSSLSYLMYGGIPVNTLTAAAARYLSLGHNTIYNNFTAYTEIILAPIARVIEEHIRLAKSGNLDETPVSVNTNFKNKEKTKAFIMGITCPQAATPGKRLMLFKAMSGRSREDFEKSLKGFTFKLITADRCATYSEEFLSEVFGEEVLIQRCLDHLKRPLLTVMANPESIYFKDTYEQSVQKLKDGLSAPKLNDAAVIYVVMTAYSMIAACEREFRDEHPLPENKTQQKEYYNLLKAHRQMYETRWADVIERGMVYLYKEYQATKYDESAKKFVNVSNRFYTKAVTYFMNSKDEFRTFLDHPEVDPTNNLVESSFRGICLLRQNIQHVHTMCGLENLCIRYTVVNAAHINGITNIEYWLNDIASHLQPMILEIALNLASGYHRDNDPIYGDRSENSDFGKAVVAVWKKYGSPRPEDKSKKDNPEAEATEAQTKPEDESNPKTKAKVKKDKAKAQASAAAKAESETEAAVPKVSDYETALNWLGEWDFNPDNEKHHMPKKIRLWMEVASRLLNEDMIKEWLPWNYVEKAGLLPPDETLQEDPAPPDDGQQKSAAPNC